ncbi:MAG: GIY-YIG nuclease family protein [Roseovarius sp.]|uniref:GIY-YIG nuclease family protein n=1 Tax=Roseovarius sp. TaxID=1486281 RepID=UPI0032EAAA25
MSSIKCFGIHFSLEKVEWDEFEICGWIPTYQNWRTEPDEPQFLVNNQRGVYILQDVNRAPLYVGRAGTGNARLGNRLWAHTRNENRGRWTHFSWFGLDQASPYNHDEATIDPREEPIDSEQDIKLDASAPLVELEALLITAIEPPLNKRGGDWQGAQRLLQWSWADEISIREVHRQVRKSAKKLGKKFDKKIT